MAKKSPPPPQKNEKEQEPDTKKDDSKDILFVSMLQVKLEEQLKIIRGPLASHVLPSAFDNLMQKKDVYETLLEFIEATKPDKRQLADFIVQQVRVLQEKLISALERDREHLQYQIELYSKALEPPSFGPPGLDVFK